MVDNSSTVTDMAEILNNKMRNAVLPVTIFVGVEAVLGFFGNLFVLYVFMFRYHACNFRYFVLTLAFVDITSSLTTIPGEMVTQLYWYIYPEPLICKVKSFFNILTVVAEALCLLTIAFDRYRKICRPMEWQIKHRNALILCCVIIGVAFVLAIPVSFLWGTHSYIKEDEKHRVNITVTVCEIDQNYLNSSSPLVYSIFTQAIVSTCLFFMLYLYIFVARALFKGRSRSTGNACPVLEVKLLPLTNEQCNITRDADDSEYLPYTETNTKPAEDVSSETVLNATKNDDVSLNEIRNTLSVPQNSTCCMHLNATNCSSSSNTENTLDTIHGEGTSLLSRLSNRDHTLERKHGGSTSILRRPLNHETTLETKHGVGTNILRRTLIMFVLTLVFILTTILYLTLLSMIARPDDDLHAMTDSEKAVYFFFFRLYFINHVINPVVYGLLDPQFRKEIKHMRHSLSTD